LFERIDHERSLAHFQVIRDKKRSIALIRPDAQQRKPLDNRTQRNAIRRDEVLAAQVLAGSRKSSKFRQTRAAV
jgi:hypothetical protein